jgi:hypothetical protein
MKPATGLATAEIDRELLDAMYWTDCEAVPNGLRNFLGQNEIR